MERVGFSRSRTDRTPLNETTREAVETRARAHRARLLSVLRVQYTDALADRGYRLLAYASAVDADLVAQDPPVVDPDHRPAGAYFEE